MALDPFARKRSVLPYKTHELPSRAAWKVPIIIPRTEVALLCERLHSIVMDRKGASFYYPNEARTQTLCRYEWHRRIGSDQFALRIGVDFFVGPTDIAEIEIYATTSDVIQDLADPAEALNDQLRGIAYRDAAETVNRALQGPEKVKSWLFVFHIETPYGLGFSRRSVFGEADLTILPTRILKDFKRISAAIVSVEAATNVSARDAASATLTTACALLTLSEGQRYEIARLDPNWSRPTIQIVKSLEGINEARLYPLRLKWPNLEKVDDLMLDRFSWVWSAFQSLTPEAAETFAAPLFAYYGATIRNSDLATLSAVGYMAALSALATGNRTRCDGDVTCSLCGSLSMKHDSKGEVPAIVDFLRDLLGISEPKKIQAMLRRTYGSQRSSFVHGARHRHREYGQGPRIPTGLPSEKAVVQQESLVYGEDLQSLAVLTRSALLHSLANLAGRELDRHLFDVRNLMQSSHFTYLSLPRLVEVRLITSTKGSGQSEPLLGNSQASRFSSG
jgi:hypothetical protein